MRTKLNKQRKQVKISRINSEQKIKKKKKKTSNQTYKYKKISINKGWSKTAVARAPPLLEPQLGHVVFSVIFAFLV